MVYLGTHCPRTSPQKLYYAHLSHLPWHDSHIREGSSVVLDHHSFDELQVSIHLLSSLSLHADNVISVSH
jgi:hypothetical protein